MVLLEEWLSRLFPYWRLIFGPLLVLSVLFLRDGFAGMTARRANGPRANGPRANGHPANV